MKRDLFAKIKWEITEKRLCALFVLLFLLTLIPLFAIAPYNHSSADDYTYGLKGHLAWEETGSILSAAGAAGEVVKDFYQTWQGTFSAIFMMGIQPAVFGEQFYFLVPVALISLFVLSTFLFLYTVLKKYLGANIYEVLLVSIPVITLSMQFLPSAVQGFYWYNGSVFYTFFYSLQLIMFSMMLLGFQSKKRWSRLVCVVLAILLSAIIGGGNYVTALLSCIWMFLATAFLGARKQKKAFVTGSMLVVCAISLMVSVMAPGNAIRQNAFPGTPSAMKAVILSFLVGCRNLVRWTTLPVVLMLLFLIPVFVLIVRRTHFSFRYPLLVSIFSFCIFSASFTPPLYGMGSEGPGRLLNIIFYSYFLFLCGNLFYILGWIYKKWERHVEQSVREKTEQAIAGACRKYSLLGTVVLGGLLIIACRFTPGGEQMTSYSAASDLLSGRAATYHQEMTIRMDVLSDSSIKDAVVKPVTVRPYVLYFSDLNEDAHVWPNTSVAEFFHKNTVSLDSTGMD